MRLPKRIIGKSLELAIGIALICNTALAQTTANPDVLISVDGEKLMGQLESSDETSVVFKSDLAGEIKVDWSKIKELRSANNFVVLQKGQNFGKHYDPAQLPQGKLEVAGQRVTITPSAGTPHEIALADSKNIIPQESFLNAFRRPKFTDYWHGAASVGFGLVQSTQRSKTFTSALNLVRAVPNESWIAPRYRTTFDFDSAYGTSTQKGTTIKTNIIHAGLEQDQYLNARLFVFGDASFDHNYSQGLTLQYTVGGGLGFAAYKDAHQELDLKGQLAYINQTFVGKQSTHLIGALLGDTYNRSLVKGLTFHQELTLIPAFSHPSDWTADFVANLGLPVKKSINFTIGVLDNYLNDPPPGFQKNSFQIITALTYKIE